MKERTERTRFTRESKEVIEVIQRNKKTTLSRYTLSSPSSSFLSSSPEWSKSKEMAVGAQIDTSERDTGSAKIPLLNGDQVHEATKVTGQYRYEIIACGNARSTRVPHDVSFKVNPRAKTRSSF